ncbi:MAG: hypothetical protein JW995_09675 [Melioribacteraceae bacterium]|nr:hypothetical protein [Melioribacteraceae bacterium]
MKAAGYDAAAYALADLGVNIVTHVPGYGASEVFMAYSSLIQKRMALSFHEEVAYSICHGASIAGKRAASLMKAHGLAKAANSVIDSLYTSLTAGLVVFVFDDYSGAHSDNIMDTESFLKGVGVLFVKSAMKNLYEDIVSCYKLSEQKRHPVVIIINAAKINNEMEFDRAGSLKKDFTYNRNILNHVVHPFFADYQYKILTARKLDGDLISIIRPKLPVIPDELPDRYKESYKMYQPFFNVFRGYKKGIVCGDTSSSSNFCLPPYDAIDIVTYIGGSIPLAIGTYMAGNKYAWALTGDFGFISAGHLGLTEAAYRELPLKIVIFYNKKAAATGGQPIDKKIMLRLLAAYEQYIKHIHNPMDPIEISQVLDEAVNSDLLSIVLVHY